MKRKIIKIDEEKCNGCGICVTACHEGAIGIENGKAKLLRDDYCDGLGNCLPVCPVNAIVFIEREALAYDEKAVKESLEKKGRLSHEAGMCPGHNPRVFNKKEPELTENNKEILKSRLNQWPVQIKLVPANAPYFNNSNLLIAADCTAFAYGNFHEKFMKNKITLVGCPKLDNMDYSEKLTEIIKNNEIKNITVARMEVPCCAGIAESVKKALKDSGKMIPWQIVILSIEGEIIEE